MLQKLISLIREYGYESVSHSTGIHRSALRRIIHKNKKIQPKTLKKLYAYTDTEPDDWYYTKIKERYREVQYFGKFMREKRIQKNYTKNDLAKQSKLSEREIQRIESNQGGYSTYSVNQLYKTLDISQQEQSICNEYLNIRNIHKEYKYVNSSKT